MGVARALVLGAAWVPMRPKGPMGSHERREPSWDIGT